MWFFITSSVLGLQKMFIEKCQKWRKMAKTKGGRTTTPPWAVTITTTTDYTHVNTQDALGSSKRLKSLPNTKSWLLEKYICLSKVLMWRHRAVQYHNFLCLLLTILLWAGFHFVGDFIKDNKQLKRDNVLKALFLSSITAHWFFACSTCALNGKSRKKLREKTLISFKECVAIKIKTDLITANFEV